MFRAGLVSCLALLALGGPSSWALDWPGEERDDLASPDPQVRRAALGRSARSGSAYATQIILKALHDTDPSIQRLAASLAAERRLRQAAPLLIQWLSHSDAVTRQTAAECLGRIGDPRAVPGLVRVLADPSNKVRLRVVRALGSVTTPDRQEVLPLLGRLRDTSARVRRAAAEVLASKRDRRAVIPLMTRLDDSSSKVRAAVVGALGELGDRAAGSAIVRLARDATPKVAAAAIEALGKLRHHGAIDVLIGVFKSGASPQREQAAAALAALRSAPAIDALVSGLRGSLTRQAAKAALAVSGEQAGPALKALLEDPRTSQGAALAALEIAREARIKLVVPYLVAQLHQQKLPLPLVVEALGEIRDPAAQRPLLELLEQPDPAVRLAALEAARPLLDERAADPLLRLLADPSREVRLLSIEILGELRSSEATPRLLPLVHGPDREITYAALRALSRVADPRSGSTLLEALRDGDRMVRRLASDALGHLHDRAVLPGLLRLCRDFRGAPRVTCVQAVGGLLRGSSHHEALEFLLDLVQQEDRAVWFAALNALAALRDPQIPRVLVARYPTLDPARQREVLAILGNDPGYGPTARALLHRALTAPDPTLSAAAAWSLGKLPLDPTTLEQLHRAARASSWLVRCNATAALARLGSPRSSAVLRLLAADPVAYVRANAALGLGRARAPQTEALLGHWLLQDSSPWVRLGALQALRALAPRRLLLPDGRAFPDMTALAAAVAQEDPDPRVRNVAARLTDAHDASRQDSWIGLFLLDQDHMPLRSRTFVLITSEGLVRASMTDARGEAWEENLPDGTCFTELPALDWQATAPEG